MSEATSRLQDAAGEGISRSVEVSGESSHQWDAAAMGGIRVHRGAGACVHAPDPPGKKQEMGGVRDTKRRNEARASWSAPANASGVVECRVRATGGCILRLQTPKLSPQPHRFFTLGLS